MKIQTRINTYDHSEYSYSLSYINYDDIVDYFKKNNIDVIEFISDCVDHDYYDGYTCYIKSLIIEYDDNITKEFIIDVFTKCIKRFS